MKILLIDIETSPEKSWAWGRWKQNIAPVQLIEQSKLLCFSYKWYGEKGKAVNISMRDYSEGEVILAAHRLLDEADVVVAHNAWGFDVKMLNRFFVETGLTPPSPFKVVDTLQVVKKNFRFPANSLKSVGQSLNLRLQKLSNDGFGLWLGCMENDPKAWKEMIKYNNMDVDAMEEMYERVRPWINNHPNPAMYGGEANGCPKCGSKNLNKRGFYNTQAQRYQRLQCKDCGGWSRERFNCTPTELKKNVLVNV